MAKQLRLRWTLCVGILVAVFLGAAPFGSSLTPSGDSTAIELDAGAFHGCAFYPEDGNVNCFGVYSPYTPAISVEAGWYGERTDYMGGDAIAFAAGDWNNCVLLATGNTTCWGYQSASNSGDYAGGDAVQMAVGYDASCVVTVGGNVQCTGGYFGGAWNERYSGGDAEWVAMSSYAACVKTSAPTLTCFGWNVTETSWSTVGTPTPAAGGHYAMCMRMEEGNVDCMNNGYTELGQTTLPSAAGIIDAVDVDGQFDRTCAALDNGDVRCWGRDNPSSTTANQTWTYAAVDAAAVTVANSDVCYANNSDEVFCIRSTPDEYEGGGPADSDGDGVTDDEDAFPDDPTEWADADNDGVGDNGDAFPNDPTESADADGDGVGDNGDAFPNDPTESADSDGDGVGDNGDGFPNDPTESTDSDGDGVGDNGDAFPNDANETADSDGDGVGDNGDAFPNDPNESADADGDGVGDNGDPFPNSNTAPNVSVGTCTARAANQSLPGGTTFNDLLAQAVDGARNHGELVSAVTRLANDWKKAGLITGQAHGAITSCVARSK